MKSFSADLHIHTVLSPCGSREMLPAAIVSIAIGRGLKIIAICDHNSAGNVEAVQKAAGRGLAVLAGMEIATSEEVHVLGLFPDAETAQAAAKEVQATLPKAGPEYFRKFGQQCRVDADGNTIGVEDRMLAVASKLDFTRTVELIHDFRGLAIASHVDRPSFSVTSQLGFIPRESGLDGIEISVAGLHSPRLAEFAKTGLPMITSSDSHSLEEIGASRTTFEMNAATFEEVAAAIKGAARRRLHLA